MRLHNSGSSGDQQNAEFGPASFVDPVGNLRNVDVQPAVGLVDGDLGLKHRLQDLDPFLLAAAEPFVQVALGNRDRRGIRPSCPAARGENRASASELEPMTPQRPSPSAGLSR